MSSETLALFSVAFTVGCVFISRLAPERAYITYGLGITALLIFSAALLKAFEDNKRPLAVLKNWILRKSKEGIYFSSGGCAGKIAEWEAGVYSGLLMSLGENIAKEFKNQGLYDARAEYRATIVETLDDAKVSQRVNYLNDLGHKVSEADMVENFCIEDLP